MSLHPDEIIEPGQAGAAIAKDAEAQREAALRDALENDLDLEPYSDGRDWDEKLVLTEIYFHVERMMTSVYEVGRRLVWAKKVLGHGRFEEWCDKHVPFSKRKTRQYMQVAAWLVPHQKMLKPAARLGVKKLVELTRLPPELETELAETGELGGVSVDEMADMTYTELKRHLDAERSVREKAEDEVSRLERQVAKKDEELTELRAQVGLVHTANELKVEELLDQMKKRFDEAMLGIGMNLSALGVRVGEGQFGPGTVARIRAFGDYIENYARLENCNLKHNAGDELYGDDWPMVDHEATGSEGTYPLPETRKPLPYDSEQA